MARMTLDDFIERIGWEENRDLVLKTVDFSGVANLHLSNPYNDYKRQYYFIDRVQDNVILSGEKIITGNYLMFDCGNHENTMLIRSYENLQDLEEDLLSGGGYMNKFTGDMIPVIYGTRQQFEIVGLDVYGNTVVFNKFSASEFAAIEGTVKVRWCFN